LNNLSQQRDDFEVVYHNLKNEATYEQWKNFAEDNNYSKITPITIVGEQVILGFDVAETTGQALIKLIDAHDGSVEPPSFDDILAGTVKVKTAGESTTGCTEDSTECAGSDSLYIFNVPFIGVIDLYKYSIPSISFILGLIDGFNPCAMWVLVTFLLVLMQIGDKRRMLEIAGLFIIAEALMYYLILTVWFTAWDFIGLDAIITPIVGIIAIGGGIFFLYEWRTSDGTCQVTDMQQRAKISSRIKKIAETKFGWKTAIGIITLALSVNVIEFACSVGIPQAYTKIIEINQLGMLETHANMLIYILAYMIDDVIVFGIAFYGIDKLHLTTKYSRASNLIGGILMIILGAILIFARELLVF
jgi:cytochrome c biogenesis protein CcdA